MELVQKVKVKDRDTPVPIGAQYDDEGNEIKTTYMKKDEIASNLENGSGDNSVQQKTATSKGTPDFYNDYYDFHTKVPNPVVGAVGQDSFEANGNSVAYGKLSFASGRGNMAVGDRTHAEGTNNASVGVNSHTEGSGSYAGKENGHAEGMYTKSDGVAAHSEGHKTYAHGYASHAEGDETEAAEYTSHAEGFGTKALANHSHAEGYNSLTDGIISHAEGKDTASHGFASHTEGHETIAYGASTHAEGKATHAGGTTDPIDRDALYAQEHHGEDPTPTPPAGTKYQLKSDPDVSTSRTFEYHLEWDECRYLEGGVIERELGTITISNGRISYRLSNTTNPIIVYSNGEWVDDDYRTLYVESPEGSFLTWLNDNKQPAIMTYNSYAHSEGVQTRATGKFSHTEGAYNMATADGAHAGGYLSRADGPYSFAHGKFITVDAPFQTAFGLFNDPVANAEFMIGNGSDPNHKSNALTVFKDGHAEVKASGSSANSIVRKEEIGNLIPNNILPNLNRTAGVRVAQDGSYGFDTNGDGVLRVARARQADIDAGTDGYRPIVSATVNDAVTKALTGARHMTLTAAQQATAQDVLGISGGGGGGGGCHWTSTPPTNANDCLMTYVWCWAQDPNGNPAYYGEASFTIPGLIDQYEDYERGVVLYHHNSMGMVTIAHVDVYGRDVHIYALYKLSGEEIYTYNSGGEIKYLVKD